MKAKDIKDGDATGEIAVDLEVEDGEVLSDEDDDDDSDDKVAEKRVQERNGCVSPVLMHRFVLNFIKSGLDSLQNALTTFQRALIASKMNHCVDFSEPLSDNF